MRSFITLKGQKHFTDIKNNCKKIYSNNLIICARTSVSSAFSVGIITSRKLGNAVVRNRIRRRIKAAMHDCLIEYKDSPKFDFVIIPRSAVAKLNYQILSDEIKNSLIKLYEKQ